MINYEKGEIRLTDICVCDDSKYDINRLTECLRSFFSLSKKEYNLFSYLNPEALLIDLQEGRTADIYILDVSMPKVNGFLLAEKIREYSDEACIIFLTSHSEQASKGYKFKAHRFIDKINLESDLPEALSSAIEELENNNNRFVALRSSGEIYRVPYNHIIYVFMQNRKLHIVTKKYGTIDGTEGINSFFNKLSDGRFEFIDRGCFINCDCISKIGNNCIVLSDGTELQTSRRSLQKLKSKIMEQWRV